MSNDNINTISPPEHGQPLHTSSGGKSAPSAIYILFNQYWVSLRDNHLRDQSELINGERSD